MKTLLSTTALVLALGLPTLVSAQTATDAPATTTADTTAGTDMPGFLASRGATDVFASELIGHDVYARRTPEAGDAQTTTGTEGMTEMTTMARADLDNMDNIGQINEIVLSADGSVRALVIGVGGFLGMGEQDVAVTIDQVTFASDPDDASEMYVVVNTGADMLKTSPAYQRDTMNGTMGTAATDAMATDTASTDIAAIDATTTGMGVATNSAETGTDATGTTAQTDTGVVATDRTAFVAPTMEREGYDQLPVTDVSAEMLVGKEVYSVTDESVGTIDDLLLDDAGSITSVIIDFGGFLGMGTSQVSVGYDELTVLADGGRADVRVYIDATKEQVQAQPQYQAAN